MAKAMIQILTTIMVKYKLQYTFSEYHL